jgi:5-methylcytosine-specific restriction endonuclease McrA
MSGESIAAMSDAELLAATTVSAAEGRKQTAELLSLLAEVDARRLYLAQGYSSLFTYCTRALRLSEHAAYHRIEAARATRRFGMIADLVAEGAVTLTTVTLLARHLTLDNHIELLQAARFKSKREVEHQVACLAPRPEVAALVRRLPRPSDEQATARCQSAAAAKTLPLECGVAAPATESAAPDASAARLDASAAPEAASRPMPIPAARVKALQSDRYLLRVTLTARDEALLRRAQDLMRHVVPDGDPAKVVGRALDLLVTQLERQRMAKARRPKPSPTAGARSPSRYVPAAVRRSVWTRDHGRCTFTGPAGRCGETGMLEIHHVEAFARGGPATTSNLTLRCRAHNQYEAEREFGRLAR